MKKFAAMLAAGLIAILGLTALAPSAQAYPTPVLTLSLNLDTVVAHHEFKAVVHADINCDTLTVSFLSQSATQPGNTLTKVFTAPSVTKPTRLPVYGSCTFTSTTGTSGHAIAVKSQTLHATAYITVVPVGGGKSNNGGLPNTGGPSIGWLIAGIAALLAGAAAMFLGRRRNAGSAAH